MTAMFTVLSSCSNDVDSTEFSSESIDLTKSTIKDDDDGYNYSNSIDADGEVSVKTVWTIGRKSRNCDGIGICKHKKTTIKLGKLPPYSFGELQRRREIYTDVYIKSVDEIVLDLDPISQQYAESYFGGKRIVLEEDLILDSKEFDEEISNNFTIPAGEYL